VVVRPVYSDANALDYEYNSWEFDEAKEKGYRGLVNFGLNRKSIRTIRNIFMSSPDRF
jgi:hypothetical protein